MKISKITGGLAGFFNVSQPTREVVIEKRLNCLMGKLRKLPR